jgi:hypothetical protein
MYYEDGFFLTAHEPAFANSVTLSISKNVGTPVYKRA